MFSSKFIRDPYTRTSSGFSLPLPVHPQKSYTHWYRFGTFNYSRGNLFFLKVILKPVGRVLSERRNNTVIKLKL